MEYNYKCSSLEHFRIDAIVYCHKCKRYMCNKCEQFHQENFINHQVFELDTRNKDFFCKEANHNEELKYYCKTHNILCCYKCIIQIKDEENGQHSNCEILSIKDIEKDKKNNLEENLLILDQLSHTIEESIKQLKSIFKLINDNKENFKSKIKAIFSEMNKIINDRKNELLLEIDNKFDTLYFKEDIIKESEKLPDKIKILLEEGMNVHNEWDDNKLCLLINTCLKIENNIKEINIIDDNLKKYKKFNFEIQFIPEEEEIKQFKETLKTFGKIDFKFSKFENNTEDTKDYSYECINNNALVAEVYEDTHEAKIDIILINNGKNIWTKNNTKLIYDKNSQIVGNEIKLGPQKPGETKKYKINLKNLNKFPVGEYKSSLVFSVDGNPFGEKLKVKIIIKDIKTIVEHFRNTFNLPEIDFSDEKLIEALKGNNYNEENSILSLIN